ncbi:endonuclease [Winogradskyella ursingii]|uniref:endonuclease n=1 Tax=Winogradskyella ursingii TaxID=2686079 RepID=UPI0015CB7217|nr:endonuclease [Winogradskyella ursingii]
MKQIYLLFLFITSFTLAQQQPYYDGIDFSQTGDNLKNLLGQLIDDANENYTYGDIRDDFKIMELDPQDNTNSNVLLTYGFVNSVSCSSGQTDRRLRDKDAFGGGTCEYNREHVFARSNANPGMGPTSNSFTGIVADPHNLRATDVQRNGNRGSKKFANGTGNSGDVGSGNWYPGDEWKGDIARIMMYMYTRYGDRCLPELNAVGTKQGSTDMLQVLLQWNVEDPVSLVEDARNNRLEVVYENRNPFIDNPYIATVIWGGPEAEDRWGTLSYETAELDATLNISPNPAKDFVNVSIGNGAVTRIEIYDVLGKRVFVRKINESMRLDIRSLKSGLYLFKFIQNDKTTTKKLIVQ